MKLEEVDVPTGSLLGLFLIHCASSLLGPEIIQPWFAWAFHVFNGHWKPWAQHEHIAFAILKTREAGQGRPGWEEWAEKYLRENKTYTYAAQVAKKGEMDAPTAEKKLGARVAYLAAVAVGFDHQVAEAEELLDQKTRWLESNRRVANGFPEAIAEAQAKEEKAKLAGDVEGAKRARSLVAGLKIDAPKAQRLVKIIENEVAQIRAQRDEACQKALETRLEAVRAMADAAGLALRRA